MSWRICFSLTNCHRRIVYHVFCVVLIFMKSISLWLSKFLQVFPSFLSWKDSFFLLGILPKETGTLGIGAHVLLCKCHGFWKEVYSSVLFLFTAFKSIFMFVKKKKNFCNYVFCQFSSTILRSRPTAPVVSGKGIKPKGKLCYFRVTQKVIKKLKLRSPKSQVLCFSIRNVLLTSFPHLQAIFIVV